MPELVPKEAVEFMTRFGGSIVSSIEEWAVDYYAAKNPQAQGKFPYSRAAPQLPMFSDLIVLGVQLPPWVIGLLAEDEAKKKGDSNTAAIARGVKHFGEGGILYMGPKTLKNTIIKNVPPKTAGAPARGQQPPPPPQTQAVVYKL
jgi:hypothetical protein